MNNLCESHAFSTQAPSSRAPGFIIITYCLVHHNIKKLKNGHRVLFEIKMVDLYYRLRSGVLLVEPFEVFNVP